MEDEEIPQEDLHHRFPPATANLKASGSSLKKKLFARLNGGTRDLFSQTAFGVFLDLTIQGESKLFHMMMLHQIRPKDGPDLDGQHRLHFKVGDYRLAYGIQEFCLITGFKFGWYAKTDREKAAMFGYQKNGSMFCHRVFPDYCVEDNEGRRMRKFTVDVLIRFIASPEFKTLSDNDAVRCALLYTLMTTFLAKEKRDTITDDWLCLVDDLTKWNSYPWGSKIWDASFPIIENTWTNKIEKYLKLVNPQGEWKYTISGFSTPLTVWIWETLRVMKGKEVIKMNKDIPRIRRWMYTKKLSWKIVETIFKNTKENTPPKVCLKPSKFEERSDHYLSLVTFLCNEDSPQVSPRSHHSREHDGYPSSHRSPKRSGFKRVTKVISGVSKKVDGVSKKVDGMAEKLDGMEEKLDRLAKFGTRGYSDDEWKDMLLDDPIPTFVKTGFRQFHEKDNLIGKCPAASPCHNVTDVCTDDSGMRGFRRSRSPRNGVEKDEAVIVGKVASGQGCETGDANVGVGKESRKAVKTNSTLTKNIPVFTDAVNLESMFNTPSAQPQVINRPKRQIDPSRYLRSPYMQVQWTRKIQRRGAIVETHIDKEGDMNRPPPLLLLEPYVSLGMDCIYAVNVEMLPIDVRHRLLASVPLVPSFWRQILRFEKGGWLDSEHVTIWVRLLMERMPEDATWCVTSDSFFVFMISNQNTETAMGTGDEFHRSRPWWEIDRVLFPINIPKLEHWVLGELWLDTMNFHLYDTIAESGSFEWLRDEGVFDRFEGEINKILEDIEYWSKVGSDKTISKITFTKVDGLPQQASLSGDCGVFMLMFMEQLVSGHRVAISKDPLIAGTQFRNRLACILWGSKGRQL